MMYLHREAMRKFKWNHPYITTFLATIMTMLTLAICGLMGIAPFILAVFVCWGWIFSYIITIPIAVVTVKYVSDLFTF